MDYTLFLCASDDHQSARKLHYFVANGINTALAYESALKVNETCFTPTVGYQLEQYIHGPRLATDSGSAVVIAVGPGSNGVLQRAYEAASWAKVEIFFSYYLVSLMFLFL